jgi:protein arginine N-methyltransferase 5
MNHFNYKDHHFALNDYLDVFQIPLQPLKDNLQSQTYECFEDDVAKYELYEKALFNAFINYKETGHLKIEKVNEFRNSNNSNKKEINNNKILNVCLVGAGRGPVMRRVINASINAGLNINPFLVEKNKNSFNTLLHLKKTEPRIFSKVTMLFGDMRNMNIDYKFDIIVSELLGSFGDNELSPECLRDVEKNYLDPKGIMIPQSYASFIRPVVYPVLWDNVNFMK